MSSKQNISFYLDDGEIFKHTNIHVMFVLQLTLFYFLAQCFLSLILSVSSVCEADRQTERVGV